MSIVDAHHHLWDTNLLHYTLFETVPALRRPYTGDDYQREAVANGVTASVCVEAASAGADGWSETRWLLEEMRRVPLVRGITAWAPLERPDLSVYLEQLRVTAGRSVAAIRRSFEFEPSDFPECPEVIAGVRVLASFGYLCELVLFERSLASAVRLVEACPEARFILDHAGKPRIREGLLEPWRSNLARLARLPNVVCKISGLSTEGDRDKWTKEQLKPYIDHAIERFGWDRVLFGSDWPVCNLAGGFGRWLEAADWATAWAPEMERRKLFSGNAARSYGFAGAAAAVERDHAG
jgi:L-fuconolactonase